VNNANSTDIFLGFAFFSRDYFGIKVPKITIPVSPGRNLAILVEVAARNFRLKSMGYDASEELITRSIGR
jgi:HPr kinase/phosphorylase